MSRPEYREVTVTIWREAETEDLDIEVTADCNPGEDECRYLPNGDPGYPGSPPEITITSAVLADGTEVTLDESETERAMQLIEEELAE